jgi:hypothetical protein
VHSADRYAWLEQQCGLLKAGRIQELDVEQLSETLEQEMGNERRELYRRLRVLIGHLLKWQYQPEQRSSSWAGTIRVQRKDLAKLLRDSPSLKRFVEAEMRDAYTDAVDLASFETGLAGCRFPATCPYDADQVFDPGFWPGPDQP